MCGIFGMLGKSDSQVSSKDISQLATVLFELSESRGKESSGIAVKDYGSGSIEIYKDAIPASEFLKTDAFKDIRKKYVLNEEKFQKKALIAHARMVTNGDASKNFNNQPVVKEGRILVHNGIITNVDDVWSKIGNRKFDVDSEVIVEILNKNDVSEGLDKISKDLKGAYSCATFSGDKDLSLIFTNTGSLYWAYDSVKKYLVFASEHSILSSALERVFGSGHGLIINQLVSKHAVLFNHLQGDAPSVISMENLAKIKPQGHSDFNVHDLSPVDVQIEVKKPNNEIKFIQFPIEAISKIKRCTKCILPESFPFINFDTQGVCNYCYGYTSKMATIGTGEDLKKIILSKKKPGQRFDCIVPFSGGRDSSYGLHYLVKDLGLRPLTYTYDWGMVTDLARRNIARMTGQLGVENILVSANIQMKRENIRKNVSAWLKNPQMGMIPLFMAGDKQFFYYVNKIKEQNDISVDVWMHNSLEDTHFKTGFAGVAPQLNKERVDYLAKANQIKMIFYYLKNFAVNPRYINSSIFDTIWSYYSYYAVPRTDFYILFDYLGWNEQIVEKTLFDGYEWELSPDTTSSWRIGDGTAAFYNYIYFTVCGFSEVDTMMSNQVREGMISREVALARAEKENQPRIESLEWYLNTINIDFEYAVKTINQIPRLYKT